jgi:hypothetical protein
MTYWDIERHLRLDNLLSSAENETLLELFEASTELVAASKQPGNQQASNGTRARMGIGWMKSSLLLVLDRAKHINNNA